jgi:hypothetical protein
VSDAIRCEAFLDCVAFGRGHKGVRVTQFFKVLRIAGLSGALIAGASSALAAPVSTTTTLTMNSGGTSVLSGGTIASGKVLTLVATVSAGGTAVAAGQVNLCDATAVSCTDIHLFGTAQLTSAGTARFRFVPGIGSHSYKAVFAGTPNRAVAYAASVSGASMLNVTGLHATTTTLMVDGPQGLYNLTATMVGINNIPKLPAPTGTISFIDTTNNNAVLASPAMSAATAGFSFLNVSKPTTNVANFVATADFNGDGHADLAVGDDNSGSVKLAILLGKGDGTFTRAPSPTVGLYVDSIAIGDFNHDGSPDLAVTSVDDNTVTILLGSGDGTFTPAPTLNTISTPQSVAPGDFNRDGLTDLAVVNGNSVLIFLGNGDGTFHQAATSASPGNNTITLAVGDFNGDANPDLAVTNGMDTGDVIILLGKGDGTFTIAPVSPSTASAPVGIAVGDFNGDGKLDLAVSCYGGTSQQAVSVLLGNGDGTFKTSSYTASGLNFRSVEIGDFNGDGIADLALGEFWQGEVAVFTGNGDGTFQPPINLSNQSFLASGYLSVADFNGDGITDLANPDGDQGGTVSILLTQPAQTVTVALQNYSVPGNGTHQVKATYSGDSVYKPSESATTPLVALLTPTVTVVPSATSISTADGVSLSVTVTGGKGNPTPAGFVYLANFNFPSEGPRLVNGSGIIHIPVGELPAGTDTLTVQYEPEDASSSIYSLQNAAVSIAVTAAPTPATPVISPASGAYTIYQRVTITDATPGAVIYYTTDGTDPSTWSPLYTEPLFISFGTLKAIALADGDGPSPIATATYTQVIGNAVPLLSGLSPTFIAAGSPAFTLTVNGTGFVTKSTVYWGTTALATQFVSPTQLTAAVPASVITAAGTATVTVQTPAPRGGTSNAMQLEIDSPAGGASPVFAAPSATVAAGSTASYKVTLPSTATNVSASCLNLPAGAACSYAAANGALTIATSATTPPGTYQITTVFTETEPAAASALAMLPVVLLPFLFVRKKAERAWRPLLTVAILLVATVSLASCGGKSASSPPSSNPTQQVRSSGVVTLTVE